MTIGRDELQRALQEQLVRALDGDSAVYEQFLSTIATMVRGYLARQLSPALRTDERIEDLVQDVLLSIHKKKHLYRPDMPVLPWVFAIARYRLIDHIRAEHRRPTLVEMDDSADHADPIATPFALDTALELEELLEELSPRQRDIVVSAKADGVPLADIAERFGMSLSAVKVTVHRALERIRRKLPKKQICL